MRHPGYTPDDILQAKSWGISLQDYPAAERVIPNAHAGCAKMWLEEREARERAEEAARAAHTEADEAYDALVASKESRQQWIGFAILGWVGAMVCLWRLLR